MINCVLSDIFNVYFLINVNDQNEISHMYIAVHIKHNKLLGTDFQ